MTHVRLLLTATAFCVGTGIAAAQVDRATLSGVVRDPSGGVIPAATIKVTSLATGVTQDATATNRGTYLVVNLAPGQYLVEGSATGFQTLAQTVALEVGQRGALDLTLPVGGLGETVTVEGITPLLDTQSAVLGSVVSNIEVSKLPLAIRNWDDLLFLLPGVQGDRYTEESGGTATGRTGGLNVHGNRSLQNNFLLDGVDNNSISTNVQELSTQVSRPSVDAIGEFKIVTSPFAAEYGRSPGAAVSVTTKSGTNRLAGTAYYFGRDERFDSNTFFSNRAGLAKPTNNQIQFGGNAGGPIVKSRLFFFGDYEGTRIDRGVIRTGRVPTEAERQGIFSGTVIDPLSGQPFANATIPRARFDPVALNILNLVPLPNTTGGNNFIRQPEVQDDNDRYLARVDFKASGNDSIFGRYSYNDRTRFVPGWFGGVLDGTSTSAWGRNLLKSQSFVGGWTKVLSGTMVNEVRVSWARTRSDGQQDPFGNSGMETIGFNGVPVNPVVAGGIVGVDITGYIRYGSPNFMPKFQHTDQWEFLDTYSWLKGKHQFKFGANLLTPMNNDYFDIPSTRGNVGFQAQFTGNAFADFLLGYARQAELSNVWVVNQRRWSTNFFVQDDWRPTDRLTLNLGLRYDFMTPTLEADNELANFNPATAQLFQGQDGDLEARSTIKPDTNNFAPRVGVVYKLNDKTVLRGGYGIFYNPLDRIGSEDQLALNPPGLRNVNITTTSTTTPVILLRDGFPPNYLDPSNIVLSRLLLRTAQLDGANARYQQGAIGFERQFGANYVVTADFIGVQGRQIALLRNLNQPANGNGVRPYPAFGHLQYREHSGKSSYVGLDLGMEKRYADGLSFRLSYTIGESKDNTPEHLAASGSPRPQDTNDIEAWYAPSDFDVRHRFVGSAIYDLPFGSGRKVDLTGLADAFLGGWTLSGIYTARTGRPFTVIQGSLEGAGWLPNLVGDPEGEKSVDNYFNVEAFERVPAGQFGNAGRNILRGPGWITVDTSLQKRFPLGSRFNGTFRWDVFNVFNRSNFGNPNADITATAVRSTISSLAGDPRLMQFAFKVDF